MSKFVNWAVLKWIMISTDYKQSCCHIIFVICLKYRLLSPNTGVSGTYYSLLSLDFNFYSHHVLYYINCIVYIDDFLDEFNSVCQSYCGNYCLKVSLLYVCIYVFSSMILILYILCLFYMLWLYLVGK